MDNDQMNGGVGAPVGGMPEMPTPEDDDLKVSNTGTKVVAIAVVVVIVAAVIAVLVFLQKKQEEVQKYEDLRTAFQKAHTAGYEEFWKKVQVDVKSMKSNADFEAKLRANTAGDPVRYAKHIKEESLSIIDNALPTYKAITPQPGFEDKIAEVTTAIGNIRNAWDEFADEYLKFADYTKNKDKLETASSHWLGRQQQPDNEKYLFNSIRYVKLLNCIFEGKKFADLDFGSMETEVTNTCATAASKPPWFRRVAFECLPMLSSPPGEEDGTFQAALELSKETNDTTSKLGIDTCLKKCRPEFESEAIGKLGLPWAEYVKAQNSLLSAIDEKLKELK